VTVVDRGAGITTEILPNIFDPFFTTKVGEPNGGMGLGLSVSQSLVEAMGGSIVVESTIGTGSKFTAIFPAHVKPTAENTHE
jgi:signal transduction histidine kinase